ncbi:hypothetical protein HYD89_00940 [Mycoplasmopsis bovis]|nr:hypothetical protein [Mycoplasmopsis bovis]QQH36103.1 hypothetical protein HYD89_00940 [Mycoplasmopsis bovis]
MKPLLLFNGLAQQGDTLIAEKALEIVLEIMVIAVLTQVINHEQAMILLTLV